MSDDEFSTNDNDELTEAALPAAEEEEDEELDDNEPIPLSQLPEEDGGEPLPDEEEDEEEVELGNEDEYDNF